MTPERFARIRELHAEYENHDDPDYDWGVMAHEHRAHLIEHVAALEARCRDNQDAHNIVTLIDERMGKGWTRSLASALFPGAPIAADKKYVFGGPHDTAAATTLTAPETKGDAGA